MFEFGGAKKGLVLEPDKKLASLKIAVLISASIFFGYSPSSWSMDCRNAIPISVSLEKALRVFSGPLSNRYQSDPEFKELSRDFQTMNLEENLKPRTDLEKYLSLSYAKDTVRSGLFQFKWTQLEGHISKTRAEGGSKLRI